MKTLPQNKEIALLFCFDFTWALNKGRRRKLEIKFLLKQRLNIKAAVVHRLKYDKSDLPSYYTLLTAHYPFSPLLTEGLIK